MKELYDINNFKIWKIHDMHDRVTEVFENYRISLKYIGIIVYNNYWYIGVKFSFSG